MLLRVIPILVCWDRMSCLLQTELCPLQSLLIANYSYELQSAASESISANIKYFDTIMNHLF